MLAKSVANISAKALVELGEILARSAADIGQKVAQTDRCWSIVVRYAGRKRQTLTTHDRDQAESALQGQCWVNLELTGFARGNFSGRRGGLAWGNLSRRRGEQLLGHFGVA